MTHSLVEPIEKVTTILNELLDKDNVNFTAPADNSQFEPLVEKLQSTLATIDYNPSIDKSTIANEKEDEQDAKDKLIQSIDTFNLGIEKQVKDTVLSTACQQFIQKVLQEHLQMFLEGKEGDAHFHNYTIPHEQFKTFTILGNLLDFQIYLHLQGFDKKLFYESLSTIVRFLFSITTSQVDIFWYYVESRQLIISTDVFDKKIISDRIAMLEICNYLNDKYNSNVPVQQDTFNDHFHFRVRTFITSLLAFDDNTGLNKYFTVANRKVPELNKIKQDFLEDIVTIQKLFNDPYKYLKAENSRELQKMVLKLLNVYDYLVSEEERDRRKGDQFAIPKPKTEAEQKYLVEKYANVQYFPENFWDSMRNAPLSDADLEYYMNIFLQSKTRQIYLLQIFSLANLYFELHPKNKREFIDSIKASNIKHITDESLTSESHKSRMYKIQKDMMNRCRDTDKPFAFLMQHICVSEKIWWGWLIYGKDANNKPFFDDKELTTEEISDAENKFTGLLPFKSKKYHNTYITPQLTRKMKTARGLEQLKVGKPNLHKFDKPVQEMTEKLAQPDKRSEVIEERNTLLWKKMKGLRQSSWFDLSGMFSKDILNGSDVPLVTRGIKRTQSEDDLELQPESKRSKV